MTSAVLGQLASTVGGADDAPYASVAAGVTTSPILWASVLLALGLWWGLPRGGAGGRKLGLVMVVISVGLFAWQLPNLVGWVDQGLFASLSAVTVLSCAAAVVARNPVYAAIWFGLALLGTAGLFLFAGAQFLGVATVTVYAGAILVTFLFVIMLSQPRGHATYDRLSWEPFLSAAAGSILVGLLTSAIGRGMSLVNLPAVTAVDRNNAAAHGVLANDHVAHLGQELLGRHLISMQAAGALMLAALVGAVAIAAHGRKPTAAAAVELASRPLFRTPEEPRMALPAEHESPQEHSLPGGIHA